MKTQLLGHCLQDLPTRHWRPGQAVAKYVEVNITTNSVMNSQPASHMMDNYQLLLVIDPYSETNITLFGEHFADRSHTILHGS